MEYFDIVDAAEDDLIFCGDRIVTWDEEFYGEPFHDRQYSRVFALWCELDEDQFALQEEEVSAVLWMDIDKLIEAVSENTIPHCIFPEELVMVKNTIQKND